MSLDEDDKVALLSEDADSEDTYTENSADDIKLTSYPSRYAGRYVNRVLHSRKRPPIYMLLSIAAIAVALVSSYFLGARSQLRLCYPKESCRNHQIKSTSIDPSALESLNGAKSKNATNMKVVANILFGRRQYVDILDCYLRRNLVINGGVLDQVNFIISRAHDDDIEWLHQLILDPVLQGRYKAVHSDASIKNRVFANLWGPFFTDPDTIYFKMDDDIVFIDDAAIPRMLTTLLSHPEAHNVQANVINNMGSHWYHLRNGAILPYLPDESGPSECNTTWRTSELPCYAGRESTSWRDFRVNYPPPSEHHRWLPLNNTIGNLMHTPFGGVLPTPDPLKCRKPRLTWSTQAQLHYSFFDNLEHKKLSRYDWGNNEGVWNNWFKRYSINFMAVRGSTVAEGRFWGENPPINASDEVAMTVKAPKHLEKSVLIDTRAIVSHYSFHKLAKDLLQTDILDRYRAYANEFVCGPRNQKVSFDKLIERRKPVHTSYIEHDLDEEYLEESDFE